ncbi:MAG: hypothetical protein HY042_09205, partial [Spirochaetia bacterium]|nr:hypothetical protein [Spirochaetia bacterium]
MNVLTFLDFGFENGRFDRAWLWPLLTFYGRDRYLYSPFYMHANVTEADDKWFLHIPAFLYFSWGEVPKDGATADVATYWQFPLFYHSADETGSHTNILGLVDWGKSADNELERLWVMPLAFYKRDSYLHLFPFFFRAVGADAPEGRSFGPLHYHSWSPEHERLWLLLHYSSSFDNGKDVVWHIAPLYWSWDNKESEATMLLPLFINYEDKTKQFSFHVNATGLSLAKTKGTTQISVGLASKGERRYVDWDVAWLYNVISWSARYPLPGVFNGDKAIADVEPKIERTPEQKKSDETPSLAKRVTISREESETFNEFQFLFGWLAFGSADNKRHFRLLPLAWLTWDANSDDRLKVILPFYVSYQSKEFEYFVLAPFYGMQRDKTEYLHSVLLFMFIYEHDDQKKAWEYSFLWPLINVHKSEAEGTSGFRVLPFYWQKNAKDGKADTFRSASLLHYYSYRSEGAEQPGAVTRKLWLTPFLTYYTNTQTKTTQKTSVIAPLFYYTSFQSEQRTSVFHVSPLHFRSRTAARLAPSQPGGPAPEETISSSVGVPILPILYYGSQTGRSWMHMAPLALFFAWGTDADPAGKAENGSAGGEYSFLQIPFFYRSSDATSTHTNILGFLDWASERPAAAAAGDGSGKRLTRFLALPLVYYFSDTERSESSMTIIPLFHSESSKTSTFNFSLLHFYSSERPYSADESKRVDNKSATLGLPIIPFLFYRSREGTDTHYNVLSLFDFGFNKEGLSHVWMIPFVFYSPNDYFYSPVFMSSSASKDDNTWFHHAPLALFFSWGTDAKDGVAAESTYWQIPFFYRSSDATGTHTNVAGLIDWNSETKADGSSALSRFFVLPVFYYLSDTTRTDYAALLVPVFYHEKSERSTFNFSLLHFYSSERENEESANTSAKLGLPIIPFLFYRSRAGSSVHLNLLTFFDFGFENDRIDRVWVWPLLSFYGRDRYWYTPFFMKRYDRDDNESWFVHIPLLSVWTWGDKNESTYTWFPFYYRNTNVNGTAHTNVAGLLDWKTDREGLQRFFLINTYYEEDREAKETSFHFMPLFFSWTAKERQSYFVAGLYLHYSADYNRTNFLYLYDRQAFLRANVYSTKFLFGAVSYETSPNEVQFEILWRAIAGYHGWNGQDKYNLNVLWYYQSRDGDQFHSSFLPFYWYSRWNSGYRLIIPPLLTYSSEDEDGTFTMVLAGAAYYRNYDARMRTDSQYVALGTAYRYIAKPERGYSSSGSLWGILWEHEHETETGYDHFSVLRLIYSRSVIDGVPIHRVLGISLD